MLSCSRFGRVRQLDRLSLLAHKSADSHRRTLCTSCSVWKLLVTKGLPIILFETSLYLPVQNQMQNQISATLENWPSRNMDFSRSEKCKPLLNQVEFSQTPCDSTKWDPSAQNPCFGFLQFVIVFSKIAPEVDCL